MSHRECPYNYYTRPPLRRMYTRPPLRRMFYNVHQGLIHTSAPNAPDNDLSSLDKQHEQARVYTTGMHSPPCQAAGYTCLTPVAHMHRSSRLHRLHTDSGHTAARLQTLWADSYSSAGARTRRMYWVQIHNQASLCIMRCLHPDICICGTLWGARHMMATPN